MKELASVVIPVYNAEKYVARCINSVLSQTYRNIEVIIVNDGSTDDSLKICEEISKYDDRIVIIDKKNSGVSDTRNIGIEAAKGDVITFVDADDELMPTFIHNYLNKMKQYDVDIVMGDAINVTGESRNPRNTFLKNDLLCDANGAIKEVLNQKCVSGTCWAKLYKTALVKQVKFPKNITIGEDLRFLLDLLPKAKSIAITPLSEYLYYIVPGSALRTATLEKWLPEITYCEALIEKYSGTELYENAVKRLFTTVVFLLWDPSTAKVFRKPLKYLRKYMGPIYKNSLIATTDKFRLTVAFWTPLWVQIFVQKIVSVTKKIVKR